MTFYEVILIAFDAVLAIVSILLAAAWRFGYSEFIQKVHETETLLTLLAFVVVVLFSSHLMEVYDLEKNLKKRDMGINIIFGSFTSFSLLSVVYYLDPGIMLGRGVLFISLTLLAITQFCWHAAYLLGKKHARFSQSVLVLGTGDLASQIGSMVATSNRNFNLAGYASCVNVDVVANENSINTNTVPQKQIVGKSDDLLSAARKVNADLIVVALSERRGHFPLRDVLRCKLNGIQIMDAPSFYELVQGKLMLESITPSWFIFSSGFRRTTLFSLCKRTVDIALSTIGLIFTIPFYPLIAIAIKIDSPGPVFFSQQRVGNNEKLFVLLKFRTMRQDAESESGAKWAEKNDPRITKLGGFLRGSRIDELPQLINVLKGDMSFIGPRPERPEFVEKLKQIIPYYSKRHFISPGLTGWAQVRYPYGSTVEDAVEKLRYDLYYTKNICPYLDTLIFFETIKVVLFGRGR
ncbi:MAG: TIGR03013 family PEP-CTERM/XrtA system glycosyltransferase [Desulfuromonadales bacterium]|nr:TIGR03013 family PEP-CTERM/XrtA system glycosyltransferase [Desulfuromonadales bacterium]